MDCFENLGTKEQSTRLDGSCYFNHDLMYSKTTLSNLVLLDTLSGYDMVRMVLKGNNNRPIEMMDPNRLHASISGFQSSQTNSSE